ncbi:MAG TPA: flagellar filament capping protein FliD [Terriglobales bacterium]|nr:flagellar filament capping protein FliD [Terriglobales bacterium]
MSTASSALSGVTGSSSTGSFDPQTYVAQIIASEQGPEQLMQQQVSTLSAQATALSSISTQLDSLQTAVFALNDFQGALAAKTATTSNSAVATATADANASAGSHTLTVANLASTSSASSSVLTDGNTTFATGSFSLQVGTGTATNITVDSTNNTLNGLAAAINGQGLGVMASVVVDPSGARLALVSNTSGAPGDLTISSNTTGLTLTKSVTGTNANFTLDGISLASTSNTATGVLPGVTLQLAGVSATPVTIAVAPDTTQATTAIQNFVTAYNAVIQSLNTQFTYNSTTQSTGPLGADGTIMQLQQQLLGDAAFSVSGNSGVTNLAAIGVNMNEDGTLTVDSSALNASMASNYNAVVNLFQQVTPAGFATNFNNDLLNITDPAQGPIVVDQNGIAQSTTALNQQITDFQNNLNAQQQQLLQVYSQVAVTLQTMPTMLAQVQSQMASVG